MMLLGELFDNIKIGHALLIIHCPQVNTCNSRQIIESISDMSHTIYTVKALLLLLSILLL